MAVEIAKASIDIGLVTGQIDAMTEFYRDTLGLPIEGVIDMPGGARMTRLVCGTTIVKLMELPRAPAERNPPGGIPGATGIRYFTISVTNLEAAVAACDAAGANVAVPIRESRPGVSIAMIEDPDGNWVELLQLAE
ncbi:MAG: VOC family protein [Pseudomonadota bacterium]